MSRLTRDVSHCLCTNLRKAARVLTQVYDAAFRGHGLRATQVSVLVALHAAGPVRMNRLAELTVTDRTTLTRNLRILAQQGYVRLDRGADRRERQVRMTDRGRELMGKTALVWQRVQQRMVKALGPGRAQRLLDDLDAIVRLGRRAR